MIYNFCLTAGQNKNIIFPFPKSSPVHLFFNQSPFSIMRHQNLCHSSPSSVSKSLHVQVLLSKKLPALWNSLELHQHDECQAEGKKEEEECGEKESGRWLKDTLCNWRKPRTCVVYECNCKGAGAA